MLKVVLFVFALDDIGHGDLPYMNPDLHNSNDADRLSHDQGKHSSSI